MAVNSLIIRLLSEHKLSSVTDPGVLQAHHSHYMSKPQSIHDTIV